MPGLRALTFLCQGYGRPIQFFEFDLKEGRIVFSGKEIVSDLLEIGHETKIFCDRCARRNKFKSLKKSRE
jgi:hypothetical protein